MKVLHEAVQHRDEKAQTKIIDYVDLLFDKFSRADEGLYICERALGGHKKQKNVTVKMIGMCLSLFFKCYIYSCMSL